VVYEESLCDASLGDLLLVVRGLDGDEDTVLLVGPPSLELGEIGLPWRAAAR